MSDAGELLLESARDYDRKPNSHLYGLRPEAEVETKYAASGKG